jgi:hypothetical protein
MVTKERHPLTGYQCVRATLVKIGSLTLFGSFSLILSASAEPKKPLESQWYIGNAIGSRSAVGYKQGLTPTVTTLKVDDSRTGWKFNIGFDVSENVAIEAGYLDLNDVNLEGSAEVVDPQAFGKNTHPTSADGFTLSSTYRFNISQNFGLTGSIGVFNWDGDSASRELINDEELGKDSNSGTDFYFGLGGGYHLSQDVILSIEWERFQMDKEDTDIWSIGVDYHFK